LGSLAHPRVELKFDQELGVTVATLSHLLDPFVAFMNMCVDDGSAIKVEDGMYHLDGFIQENARNILSQKKSESISSLLQSATLKHRTRRRERLWICSLGSANGKAPKEEAGRSHQ
jgi:hypothetical protein